MTQQEKIIVMAYTGVSMTDFSSFHAYAEKKLGRPIFTHQFADKEVVEELKNAVHSEFVALCA